MKLRRNRNLRVPTPEPTVFDAVPVRSYGPFEWPPIPAPYRPKTADELAAEVAAAILADDDTDGSIETEPTN